MTVPTPEQIDAVLAMMTRGASPAMACAGCGVDVEAFHLAVDCDDELRDRVERTRDDLSWTVASQLFLQAMNGNVSAMTNYLRLLPPRRETSDDTDAAQLLDDVDDDHIGSIVGASETEIHPGIAATLQGGGVPPQPEPVPPTDPADAR